MKMMGSNARRRFAIAMAFLGAAAVPMPVAAQCDTATLLTRLDAPDVDAVDAFGSPVAISGKKALIADWQDDVGGNSFAGSVYVMDAETGALITTLNSPVNPVSNFFGQAIAITGNLAAVFSRTDTDGFTIDEGLVQVFDATSGQLIRTIYSPNTGFFDYFGRAMAASGDLLVAASADDNIGELFDVGTVYVFSISTGTHISTFVNPDPEQLDFFGNRVAISGTTAVVAADRDQPSVAETKPGKVYLFNATTGGLLRELVNPEPAKIHFGASVAISGNVVAVGAREDDTVVAGQGGAVFTFNATTGALIATIANPDPTNTLVFGAAVAIEGSTVIVGAPGYTIGDGSAIGEAFVFDAVTGALRTTIYNPQPEPNDIFGEAVAIDGGIVVVGAPNDRRAPGVATPGAAFTFTCVTPLSDQVRDYLLGKTSTPPDGGDLNQDGAVDVADLVIALQDAP